MASLPPERDSVVSGEQMERKYDSVEPNWEENEPPSFQRAADDSLDESTQPLTGDTGRERLLSRVDLEAQPNGTDLHEKGLRADGAKSEYVLPTTFVNAPRRKPPGTALIIAFLLVLFGIGYLIAAGVTTFTRYGHTLKVNVILMISDGFGVTSETFAREYLQYLKDIEHPSAVSGGRWDFPEGFKGVDELNSFGGSPKQRSFGILPLDQILVGASRTRSADSLVTDSAAGATAFACGLKTFNGAIGVEPTERLPCGTVLEAAKHRGYLTGLVVTSRITHATPATFYAHVADRDAESRIADFLVGDHPLGMQVDYALGGGLCFFLPNTTAGSCRNDDQDMLAKGRKNSRKFIFNATDLRAQSSTADSLNTVGLFNSDHMDYEVDRESRDESTREPSLVEMASKAIDTLSAAAARKSAHGYFLMIEGSRIDHAGHSNDPIAHVYDILAYQETVRTVKQYVDKQNEAGWPTVMVSVSDHETGGLSLARQLSDAYPEYAYYPDALLGATHSTIYLAQELAKQSPASRDYVSSTIFAEGLNITDYTEAEMSTVLDEYSNVARMDNHLADMVSRRAQMGWATHGHSGMDVNLYAYGYQSTKLRGNIENTEIGKFIIDLMQIDVPQITKDLTRNVKQWYSPHTDKHADEHGLVGVAHYHHEF
ncbi:uncharacterized protein L969DRAFT_94633 [Mixia osmundae IAM 14324]|uniref:Alkaline phosphatase n=1 Tax=Mixia osmundae (strain CBS 9802 / IAM 14324 / JCM 22182 / KY 12970) TaxID=764103 RepID=G7DVY0_MIXOS|nr:uncharacterized protein L969DRAFT_94633 [Mixia osmundae IAM 14324]KEI39579.1 hypothetical protein L969DRAFT_94633 [Mixia osmundae IAM 14324]GAA94740.1 hypothetical protein E5Q_01394 [Mixia osmundae IAM 14324]